MRVCSAVVSSVLPALVTWVTPVSTVLCESPSTCWTLSAVSLLRSDRLRTSSATTAKPLPCSPARAGEQGRGFERQQVGLVGDGADHLHGFLDPLITLLDRLHAVFRFLHLADAVLDL